MDTKCNSSPNFYGSGRKTLPNDASDMEKAKGESCNPLGLDTRQFPRSLAGKVVFVLQDVGPRKAHGRAHRPKQLVKGGPSHQSPWQSLRSPISHLMSSQTLGCASKSHSASRRTQSICSCQPGLDLYCSNVRSLKANSCMVSTMAHMKEPEVMSPETVRLYVLTEYLWARLNT